MRCVLLVISVALVAKSALTPAPRPWLVVGQPYLEDLIEPARRTHAAAAEAGLLSLSRNMRTTRAGSLKVSDAGEWLPTTIRRSAVQEWWD